MFFLLSSTIDDVPKYQVFYMYVISHNMPLDIVEAIMIHMRMTIEGQRSKLPYDYLIRLQILRYVTLVNPS